MQGWRKSNEDAMIMEPDIGDGNSLFAVFDGHGGEHVAKFCKKHYIEILKENKNYKKGDYVRAMKGALLKMDQKLLCEDGRDSLREIIAELNKKKNRKISKSTKFFEEKRIGGIAYHMGSVAIIVLITRDYLYCANLGDSRATLAEKMKDSRIEIVEMSKDHKPDDELEEQRIKDGGRWVILNRIEGKISIARGIGDW